MSSTSQQNKGPDVLVCYFLTLSVAAVLVLLRLWTRILKGTTGWDDYTILAALAVAILGGVVLCFQVVNGGGKHRQTLTPNEIENYLKWNLAAELQFTVQTCLVKISICLFLLRLINRTRKHLRQSIYVLMSSLIAITVAVFIVLLAQCRPLKARYDLKVSGKCLPAHVITSVGYAQAAYNVLTDFISAGLPGFILYKLRMTTRVKVALSAVMGLGVFTASCSLVRIALLRVNESNDVTYAPWLTIVFWTLEANLGIIVASLPTLRSVFDLFTDAIAARIRSYYTRRLRSVRVEQSNVSALGHGGDGKPSDDGVSLKNLIRLEDETSSGSNNWHGFHGADDEADHSKDDVRHWVRMGSLNGNLHEDHV